MKNPLSSKGRTASVLHELCFQLTFISSSPDSWAVLCLLAGKFLTLSQPLMRVFYDTSYSRWSQLASYFNLMSNYESESTFHAQVYALFAIVNLFIGLGMFQFFYLRRCLNKSLPTAQFLLLGQLFHGFLVASAKMLPHVCIPGLAYGISRIISPDLAYPKYKNLHLGLHPAASAQLYVSVVLLTIVTVEVIISGLGFLALCQDRSIRKTNFWSANTWYHTVAELGFGTFVQVEFFIDISSLTMSYIMRLAVRTVGFIIIVASYTKYLNFWVDLAELMLTTFETTLTSFVLLFAVLDLSFENYATYPVLLLIFSGFAGVVRAYAAWSWQSFDEPKSEAAAAESIRGLVRLAMSKDQKSMPVFVGLLSAHVQMCRSPTCPCKSLLSNVDSPNSFSGLHNGAELKLTSDVHFRYEQVPENVRHGLMAKILRLLVEDFASHASKAPGEEEIGMLLAEITFYVFGNFYAALQQVAQVVAGKPRLITRQRSYNLRRIISMGFDKFAETEEDPEQIIVSLQYLKLYHKFLDEVEDATESTIKFWSIVSEEAPSSAKLNDLGKTLFKCKYKATKTVEKIAGSASNHIEFLVRYGLFMRLVMHDNNVAEQAFQKILAINSSVDSFGFTQMSFSIFRFDVSVMLLLAQLERSGSGSVVEMNIAVEQTLGYSRKDLIGSSILNIMPRPIAQVHEELVQHFFQTMTGRVMGVPQALYVKTKDGLYVLCRCLMKIVPKLDCTIRAAMFLVPDRKAQNFTAYKRDPTQKRTASILCMPSTYTLVGFTREALKTLGIAEDRMKEFVGSATLYDVFPWMVKKELMEAVFANEGAVVSFNPSQILGAQVGQDSDLVGLVEDLNVKTSGPNNDRHTLLWLRLVVERCEASLLLVVLVLSEIPKDLHDRYVPVDSAGIFYHDPKLKVEYHMPEMVETKQVPGTARGLGAKKQTLNFNISDVASVASMASIGTTTHTDHSSSMGGFQAMSQELQIAEITKRTPTTIKGLAIGMCSMLCVVIVLLVVSAYVSLQEVSQLKASFEVINIYHWRYKGILLLVDSDRTYGVYLALPVIETVNNAVRVRTGFLTAYNVETRKMLFSQGLDYDSEMVRITDLRQDVLDVTFSYALILLVRNGFAVLSPCVPNMTQPICNATISMAKYSYELGCFQLMVKQDDVMKRMEADLRKLAREGESTQYTIIAICLALVVSSAAVIMPIFVWVIKDKSYVLAIFSDVTPEEAQLIIKGLRKVDIKNLRYKRSWITRAEALPDKFWDKLVSEHRRGFGRSDYQHVPKKDKINPFNPLKPDTEGAIKNAEEEIRKEKKEEEGGEGEGEDLEDEEKRRQLETQKDLEAEKKREKRYQKLSEIDYPLRRMFIVRMLVVLLIFFCYGGFEFYFNKYVHDNNAQATEILFLLCKQSLYIHTLSFVLYEAFVQNSTAMVGNNPDPNGKLFAMDIVDAMLRTEAETKDFQKSASRMVYGEYLDLATRADTSQFCVISDSFGDVNVKSATPPCPVYYKGPVGITKGVAFYLDYHILLAQKFIALNYSNPVAVAAMKVLTASMIRQGPFLIFPLSFALGGLVTTFYSCALRFFDTVSKIVYGTSIGFSAVFVAIYVFVFARFILTLNEEIWNTRGMINMIPAVILEKNASVREQVWKRKGHSRVVRGRGRNQDLCSQRPARRGEEGQQNTGKLLRPPNRRP